MGKKILIAGHEIGGQMQLLAETIRRRGIEATAVAFNNDFRGYQNDINICKRGIYEHLLFFCWAIKHYDIFHFFWGISLLDWWRFHLLDLPLLKWAGKKIFPHFRGLDIVDIAYFDYLRAVTNGEQVEKPAMSRPDQLKKLKRWRKYSDKMLVSEPDLFDVAPEASLSPQVIDLSYWETNKKPLSEIDGVMRIVHAPTSRRKKGTEYLEKAIENLKQRGYKIELLMAENLQAHNIKAYYEQADIGVDQLLYGWHGKVSCELMAMKKPVICYINPRYGRHRPDLPIVSATPSTIEDVLEKLITDKEKRLAIGEASLRYVSEYHDVEKVVDELLSLYGFDTLDFKINERLQDVKSW